MKNKTLKNLIVLGAFAVFVFGANNALAAYGDYIPYGSNTGYYSYGNSAYNTKYSDNYGNNTSGLSNPYDYTKQNNYLAQPVSQQYVYANQTAQPVQQQVQYVAVPQQQIQYVPAATTTVKYVPATNTVNSNTQGASVARAVTTTKTNTVATATGLKNNTGQYVNYDANQNMMLSNAYGAYNGQQVAGQPTAYDSNGVAALSVGGTGGFMPSSFFQWFILILLIFAIVIVARMVSKTFNRNAHTVPAH